MLIVRDSSDPLAQLCAIKALAMSAEPLATEGLRRVKALPTEGRDPAVLSVLSWSAERITQDCSPELLGRRVPDVETRPLASPGGREDHGRRNKFASEGLFLSEGLKKDMRTDPLYLGRPELLAMSLYQDKYPGSFARLQGESLDRHVLHINERLAKYGAGPLSDRQVRTLNTSYHNKCWRCGAFVSSEESSPLSGMPLVCLSVVR